MYSFELSIPQLTNWQAYLTRINQSSQRAFFHCSDEKIGRVFTVGGQAQYVEVQPRGSESDSWCVVMPDGSRHDEPAVRRQLQRVFSLDADLAAFYASCGADPALAEPIKQLQGARLLCDADVFACALSTIISQQINLSFAGELKKRLWELAGVPVTVADKVYYADPLPTAVARLDYADLQALQFTRRKSEYIIDFARSVADGSFDIAALQQLDDVAAMDKLCTVRGFGPWTAECILLFGLGRPDLLPAKDVGLQRALTMTLGRAERIGEQEVRKLAETWRPWRSWATYYLWLALSLPDGTPRTA